MQEFLVGLALLLAGGYAAFSEMVYRSLRPSFAEMRLLAASRSPEAPAEVEDKLRELLSELQGAGSEQPATGRSSSSLAKEDEEGWLQVFPAGEELELVDWSYSGESLRVGMASGGRIVVSARAALPVPERPAALQRLLAELPPSGIVEEIPQRVAWHSFLDAVQAVPLGDLPGEWEFCFRDYVNEEELAALAGARGAFSPLSLTGRTKLVVVQPEPVDSGEEGFATASLTDRFALLGVLPLQIKWFGDLRPTEGDRCWVIDWKNTEAQVGWPPLWRSFLRPAPAERLRQQPWEILSSPAASDGRRVLVLCRRGVGRLAFQRAGGR